MSILRSSIPEREAIAGRATCPLVLLLQAWGPTKTSLVAGWLGCPLLLILPGSAAATLSGVEVALTYEHLGSILTTDTFIVGSGREIDCGIDSSPQLCSLQFDPFVDVDADSLTFGLMNTDVVFADSFNGVVLTLNDPTITITGAALTSSGLDPGPTVDFGATWVSVDFGGRDGDASTGTVVAIQTVVPEPSTAALLGVGLVLSAASSRRTRAGVAAARRRGRHPVLCQKSAHGHAALR